MKNIAPLGLLLSRPGGPTPPLALYGDGAQPLEPEDAPRAWADPLLAPCALFETQLGSNQFLAAGFSLFELDGSPAQIERFDSFGDSLALYEARMLRGHSQVAEFAHLSFHPPRGVVRRGWGHASSLAGPPLALRWGLVHSLSSFEPPLAELKTAIALEAGVAAIAGEGLLCLPWGARQARSLDQATQAALAAREALALRILTSSSPGRAGPRL